MYTLPDLNDIHDSHSLQDDSFVFRSIVIEFCSNNVVGQLDICAELIQYFTF